MTASVDNRPRVAVPGDLGTRTEYEGIVFPLFSLFQQIFLVTGERVVSDRVFRNCVIEGPAVLLALEGVAFDGCNMGQTPDNDISSLLLRPMSPSSVTGAIAVRNSRFENCVFNGVGFTGADEFLNHLTDALGAPRRQR